MPLPAPEELPVAQFTEPDDRDRRLKLLRLPERMLFDLVRFGTLKLPQRLLVVKTHGIPPDARPVGFYHDWMNRCINIAVFHPSFDPVPDGEQLPDIGGIAGLEFEVIPTPGGGEVNPDAIKFE